MSLENLGPYECVDPEVGKLMWNLDRPDLDDGLRQRLKNHLEICEGCQVEREAEAHLAAAVRTGTLRLEPAKAEVPGRLRRPRHRSWRPACAGAGALLVAASLSLVVLLPPRSTADANLLRDLQGPAAFRRPVEGEIVAGNRPLLRWLPVPGATAYRLSLVEIGGDFAWEATGTQLTAQPPHGSELPRNARFRATLRTVPGDLLPPEQGTISFRTGSLSAVAGHRVRQAPPGVLLSAGLGAILIGVAGMASGRRGVP